MPSIYVSESLQTLIDCRLDTIDRMLLVRLPWSQRLEIVREVELQILEALGERNTDELTPRGCAGRAGPARPAGGIRAGRR
jgi:hypothetical protein